MGQSVAVRIENAVTIDDGMSWIGKQQDSGMRSVVGNFGSDFLQIFFPVYGDGKNDCVFEGRVFKESIQLSKLSNAKRSPVTAIEYENHIFLVSIT